MVSILFLRNFIDILFYVLRYLIFFRILFSFLPLDPYRSSPLLTNIIAFVSQLTEPILSPFRSVIPPLRMGAGAVDFSPLVALIILEMLHRLVINLL